MDSWLSLSHYNVLLMVLILLKMCWGWLCSALHTASVSLQRYSTLTLQTFAERLKIHLFDVPWAQLRTDYLAL